MMDDLKRYLISVICASLLCGIVNIISNKIKAAGALIKILAGVFLALCVLQPIVNLDLTGIDDYIEKFAMDSSLVMQDGTDMAAVSIDESIKQRTEAYILDKAAVFDAKLTVEVTLSDDSLPVPEKVLISGNISPYAKSALSQIIVDDLGISKEQQIWI